MYSIELVERRRKIDVGEAITLLKVSQPIVMVVVKKNYQPILKLKF